MEKKKLILGVTVGGSSKLLTGQVSYFIQKGYEVYLMSPDHFKEKKFCETEGCIHLPVPIEKEISPIQDLKALWVILQHLRKVKPDIVNVGTPKMGLLGSMAAWLLGIKKRVFTCRGLRYEGDQGFKRRLLMAMERLSVFFATDVIYVGHSLKAAATKYGTADPKKSHTIAKGSSNGVDISRFDPTKIDLQSRQKIIDDSKLTGKTIIGYAGRVSRAKGSYELVNVFEKIHRERVQDDIALVLIGHKDCSKELEQQIENHPAIYYIPFQENIPLYFSIMDIFILPSWREGFSNVSIQVAAMGIPLITTDATGCPDAVKDGFNGTVFPLRSEKGLEEAILKYINSPKLIREHGENGKEWAQHFIPQIIWEGLDKIYQQ